MVLDEYDIDDGGVRWLRGIAIQRRVVVALVIRLLMTKYGRSNIGFLWIVLEPMILCTGVLIIRSLIQSSGTEGGVSLIAMLTTGYLPLTLFRHITNSGTMMLRRSGPLLYHRDISLFDCAFATMIIEMCGCTLAAFIVYYALYSLNLMQPVYDIGTVLAGWIMMFFLSAGIMMIFAVLTEFYEASERFIQPFQYITIPVCGFFFMMNWLPTKVQNLAWYVPTIHCYEMIRAGVFGPSIPTYYTPWYPCLCGLLMLAWAMPLVDKARNKIHFG